MQAAVSRKQGPTAGQPTAESCQAAARRGGLANLAAWEIKGWRVGGGQWSILGLNRKGLWEERA